MITVVPDQILLPSSYLGFVVNFGLASRSSLRETPLSLAISERVSQGLNV
jgi:hypothetical protein